MVDNDVKVKLMSNGEANDDDQIETTEAGELSLVSATRTIGMFLQKRKVLAIIGLLITCLVCIFVNYNLVAKYISIDLSIDNGQMKAARELAGNSGQLTVKDDPISPVEKPTVKKPFMFFHQRKSGGSTLRTQIFRAAMAFNVSSFIPCFTQLRNQTLHCQTYFTPQIIGHKPIPAIYGGHFYFPPFLRTLYLLHDESIRKKKKIEARVEPPQSYNYSCMTVYREPISRIQSCWNFRMIDEIRNRTLVAEPFASIPANVMESSLSKARSRYGEGCLNEPMRVFSDFGHNEAMVNTLHSQPDVLAEHALYQTIERSNKCIVGILERCNDTKLAIQKYLPFLVPYFSCDEQVKKGTVAKETLTDQQLIVVQKLARYEQRAYQEANKRLDRLIA